MAKLKIIRKGKLPFRKLKITINNVTFCLKGYEYKEIELPQGNYSLIMKMDWWQSSHQISINSESININIKHYLPDLFYILGVTGSTILALLTFFSLIGVIYISTWVLLFIIPQIYYYFAKYDTYFSFETTKINRDM